MSNTEQLNLTNLCASEKTKRKRNYPCSKCEKDIIVGDRYMSVTYDDAYTYKLFGAYHIKCWVELLYQYK